MFNAQPDGVPKSAATLVCADPCALLWPAAMIVWGPGFVSARHKHHSVQLVMAIEGSLRIRGGPSHRWIECGAALVRAGAPHEVDRSGVQIQPSSRACHPRGGYALPSATAWGNSAPR